MSGAPVPRGRARDRAATFYRATTHEMRLRGAAGGRILVSIAGALMLGAALGAGDPPAGNASTGAAAFAAAAARAEAAIERARGLGNLWAGTAATLAHARVLAASGALNEAIRDAAKAEREAGLAIEQSLLERARYVHDRLAATGAAVSPGALDELWRMILERRAEDAARLATRLLESHGP